MLKSVYKRLPQIRGLRATTSSLYLFILLVFFTIPRLITFLTKENYFNTDFAFYYFIAKTFVVDHQIPLIGNVVTGGVGGFAQGVGWNYLLAIPFFIFGGNPYGAKLLMLMISVLILIVALRFSWSTLGKREAIFIVMLLGFSPYLIAWSSSVLPTYVTPLLAVLYLWSLALFLSRKNIKYYILMAISLVLMAHFELASLGLMLPGFILLTFYLLKIGRLKKKGIILPIFLSSLLFLPHIIYDLTHNFYNLRGVLGLFSKSSGNFISNFIANLPDRKQLFRADLIEIFPYPNFRFLVVFLLFLIYGCIVYIKDKTILSWKKIFNFYLLTTIPLTYLSLCVFPAKQVPFWWITYNVIFLIFFAGINMSYLLFHKGLLSKLAVIIVMIAFFNSFNLNFRILLDRERALRSNKYAIKIQAPIEYIYLNSSDQPFKVIYITGNNKVQDFQFMFWYLGISRFTNSRAVKDLDLRFENEGGIFRTINEKDQFNDLKNGIYYIITTPKVKETYFRNLVSETKFGPVLEKQDFGDLIIERREIKNL